MSAEDWRRVIDINLTGHFLVIRAVLPLMKGRGWGRIINIGSASIFEGLPGQAHFTSQPATPIPSDDPKRQLKIARPNTDESLLHIGLVGDTYTVLISGDDTNCRYCVIDMHIPPDGGPAPHRHDFEESFSVLDGEIAITFRGNKSVVRAGETVSIPANAPHSFTNPSKQPARLLCICAPAGQEEFFAKVGVPVPTRTTPPPKLDEAAKTAFVKKAEELAPSYRTELLKP
jgi:mannose-6-phosphate isomerase-like protein (cupin superfamily)